MRGARAGCEWFLCLGDCSSLPSWQVQGRIHSWTPGMGQPEGPFPVPPLSHVWGQMLWPSWPAEEIKPGVSSQHFCVWISWRNPLPLPKIFGMSRGIQGALAGVHSAGWEPVPPLPLLSGQRGLCWDPEQASAQARTQKSFHIPHVHPKQIPDELNLLKVSQGHQHMPQMGP